MDYFIERNIVEIKNEYTTFLINIMTPFIYEGIRSVYQFALNAHKELVEKGKHDPEVKSPGVLKLFQISLKEIPTLNNNSIEIETNRIKSGSKCSDWFDDLVKAVIKSNIILLTFSNPKKRPEILREQYHNKVEVKDFIHKCYIESARQFYNSPELFWHEFPPLEIKRNQREACELIKQAIHEAIRKMLPIKLILKEYLLNDYLEENDDIVNKVSDNQYMNIHSMVKRDLYGENDPLGRKPVPAQSVIDPNDTMEGGNGEEEDYTQDDTDDDSDSDDDSDDDNENEDDENDELNGGAGTDSDEDGNEDEFLKSVQEKLRGMENNPNSNQGQEAQKTSQVIQQSQPGGQSQTVQQPQPVKQNQSVQVVQQSRPVQAVQQTQVVNKIQNEGDIPRLDMDDEIKQLLKKSNVVTSLDGGKRKPNKKELMLMKEIEDQIKPKIAEPDRKLFFEQYMK